MYNLEHLLEIVNKFREEADSCLECGNYLASIVFYGATLEAVLLGMCFVYPEKVRRTKHYERIKKNKRKIRKRGIFLEFSLNDLIKIGEELEWLPNSDKSTKSGIMWCKETRDLIHPARWLKPDRYFKRLHKLFSEANTQDVKSFAYLSKEIVECVAERFSNM